MNIYNLLKAKFLVDDQSPKNWTLIIGVVICVLVLIGNNHVFEQKIINLKNLTEEVKEYRTEYVERRSELMLMKLESSVEKKMEDKGIFIPDTPPAKIKVEIEKEKPWYKKLWQ